MTDEKKSKAKKTLGKRVSDAANTTSDFVENTIDKVSTPSSRAGSSIERIAKMDHANVDKEVIALQMTKNSARGHEYTTKDVETCSKIYSDSITKVVVTADQSRVLISDQTSTSDAEDEDNEADDDYCYTT